MVRDSIDDEWRVVSWEEAIARSPPGFRAHPGRARRRLHRRHLLLALHQRGGLRRPEDGARGVRQQQHRHLRAGLPLAHRLRAEPDLRHLRRHPGLQVGREGRRDPAHRRQPHRRPPGVRLPDEAAAARRAPRSSWPTRAGSTSCAAPHVEAAHHLPVLPGSNVAFVNAMAHIIVTEGLHDEAFLRERCENVDDYLAFIARRRELPRGDRGGDRRPARASCARRPGSTPPAANSAIYYGLGVTEHSQGSTMVMGMANLAMVTGNIGREGVGRQPAARAEQRPGLLRHGLLPPRVPRLPPRLARRRARHLRVAVGARRWTRSPACASPTCSTRPSAGRSAGSSSRARTSRSPTPTPSTSRRRCRRWTWSSSRTCSSTRPPGSPTSSCPALSFLEKDGTFTNAERRINRVRPVFPSRGRQGRVAGGLRDRAGHGLRHALRLGRARSWTRSPRPRRPSPASPSPGSTRRARCSGRSTTPHRTARPRCTSGSSCAARATWWRRSTCRPPSAPPAATRWCSPRAASSASTTSARRPGVRPTRPGTPRTSWRSTPPTPTCAGSRPATGSSCPVAGRHDHAAPPWCPSGCPPASSTRPSTTRSPAPTWSRPRTPTGPPTARSTR